MQYEKSFETGENSGTRRNWLLLGGTGTISTGVVAQLSGRHWVTCVNRGHRPMAEGVEQLVADVYDDAALTSVLDGRSFDVVVDFLTYTPETARTRVRQFQGRCGRYVFISSATTYEKPPRTPLMTEDTPQSNPFSDYAQKKIQCENVFRAAYREEGFPMVIVRPSLTYGDYDLPFAIRPRGCPMTLLRRLRAGRPILVPGDGTTFFTMTHNSDFARGLAGLMENPDALGEDFHITQDECMTWDQYAQVMAEAAGAPAPVLVHRTSEELIRLDDSLEAGLLGDKSQTAIFDNSKLRRYVPGFRFDVPFREGVRRIIRMVDSHPELQRVDDAWDAWIDGLIAGQPVK